MKKLTAFLMSLSLLFAVAACDNNTTDPVDTQANTQAGTEAGTEEQEFTLDELAEFDGQDGRRAYVAVDGVVYDLTDSSMWQEGQHNGFSAGNDLTDEIKNDSPHGVRTLEGMPVVGKLVD